MPSAESVYELSDLFAPPERTTAGPQTVSSRFVRTQRELSGGASLILDEFHDVRGASCCFVRLPRGPARTARFTGDGARTLESCPSGGWVVRPADEASCSYWVPQPPMLRKVDAHGRILSEQPASLVGLDASSTGVTLDVEVSGDSHLDCAVWRMPPDARDLLDALQRPSILEMQPVFMWGSHTAFRGPAGRTGLVRHCST